MELILWRHAEAEDGTPDIERRLTPKGIKQARRIAKWLKPRLPEDTLVLTSPARRTLQTVAALSDGYRAADDLGTSGTPESLLTVIGWPRPRHSVVVVGHQPTLGETAALLLTGRKLSWSLKKGGIIWLAARDHGGVVRVHLRAAISPDLV